MLRVSELYKDLPPSLALMGMSADVPLGQSALGPVQAGSVQSFQQKPSATSHLPLPHPRFPSTGSGFEPPSCAYVLSEQEILHQKSLDVSFNVTHRIEAGAQGQSLCQEWHHLRRMWSLIPPFGLLEVLCSNIQSYVDCPYLKCQCFEAQEAAQVLQASSRSDAPDRAREVWFMLFVLRREHVSRVIL